MAAALSIFDRNRFYLKNVAVVEQLADIDTIVMDKTGTITTGTSHNIKLEAKLSDEQKQLVYSVCTNSTHPLSRMICQYLGNMEPLAVSGYNEVGGKGIHAFIKEYLVRVGSSKFVLDCVEQAPSNTKVHIAIDDKYLGFFLFRINTVRD
ncbi:hypothetical protein [Mucilaginibacter antarcticus]|uniref:hypothetical protein n=1 Tax=Mucilaginibacter antarcticus TaxID=1855725 RepID=UPI003625D7FD